LTRWKRDNFEKETLVLRLLSRSGELDIDYNSASLDWFLCMIPQDQIFVVGAKRS